MKKKKIKYYNNEEKKLIQSYKNVDLDKIKTPSKKRQKELMKAAKEYNKINDAHLHIRINSEELSLIKEKARTEGLKYSSFIKSILHKYITGQLLDKPFKKAV